MSLSSPPGSSSSPYDTKSFVVSKNGSGGSIEVKIAEPKLRADGLTLETWASSHILAGFLHSFQINFPSSCLVKNTPDDGNLIPILELGAGTGLVGISAQAIWGQPAVLTDLEPIIPGIQLNIDLNSSVVESSGCNVAPKSGTLDWKVPDILVLSGGEKVLSCSDSKAHVILAADTVYSEEQPELLTDVITRWLSKDREARVLIAYPMRVAYLDVIRDLWNRFEEAGLEAVGEGRDTARGDLFDDELLIEWCLWRWKPELCV
ncbi:hypothetical protein TWF694_005182 [Orbilia ellipsospora]|uniref:Uncharacterized protein n=1 Tax=Orbilia ellipsospora TaxID=2528407 RepID=A0AAV9WVX4_9PEZI